MRKKILLTGGHAGTTALSVIQELTKQYEPKDLLWVGPQYAFEGSNKLTLEFKVFPLKNVECQPIVAGRLQRKFTRYTLSSLVKIPVGFVQAFFILLKSRPDVILSFGGFASFPVIVMSSLFRIPVVIHEQTAAFGLANKLSAVFAHKIAIARLETKQYIDNHKVVHVGNPLMKEILEIPRKTKLHTPPVLFITGGSRGSQIINKSVDAILEKLLEHYEVIHQTGDFDYDHFSQRKAGFPKKLQDRYEVFNFSSPLEIHSIYKRADVLVGRAGANTVSETLAIGLPSIFIPIPWSQNDEQTENAKLAVKVGKAVILKQKDLNGDLLYSTITGVFKNYSQHVVNKDDMDTTDRNAARELAALLNTYIS